MISRDGGPGAATVHWLSAASRGVIPSWRLGYAAAANRSQVVAPLDVIEGHAMVLSWLPPTRRLVALALSLVGGYVDVVCVIRYNTFIATMTGNLVITGQTFFEVLGELHAKRLTGGAQKKVRNHEHIAAEEAAYLVAFRLTVIVCNCMGAYAFCLFQRKFPVGTVRRAAPIIAVLSILPDIVAYVASTVEGAPQHEPDAHYHGLIMWSVCSLAFALGATHFLCSPAAEGGRLKAVTMAATGHMHGISKLLSRQSAGDTLKPTDWEKMKQSATITIGMALGAICGAAAVHLNPFGSDPDDGLLLPVGMTLLLALVAHDTFIEPPGGWPAKTIDADLREPLTVSAVPPANA